MKINVIVQETQVTEYTYEVTDVNSIETAKKAALQAVRRQYQPKAWMLRKVPYPPTFSVSGCEVVEI